MKTENQVRRIEKIYDVLNLKTKENTCAGMESLISEANELIENKPKSSTLDAAIISCAQKVEHYEIASYGTLKSFAKTLGLKSEILDLLQDKFDVSV